jgi:hypothetical protein
VYQQGRLSNGRHIDHASGRLQENDNLENKLLGVGKEIARRGKRSEEEQGW